MTSLALNQKDTYAIESAVRSAIEMVMNVLYRVNNEKLQEYHRNMIEKHKENQKLKGEVEVAAKELEILRRHARNLEHLFRHSDRPSDNQLHSGNEDIPQRVDDDGHEPSSMADWQSSEFKTITSAAEPQGGPNDYQNSPTNIIEAPGYSNSSQGPHSPLPNPVSTIVVKEEPSEMDTVYIKWEMSGHSVGNQHEGLAQMEEFEGECGLNKENGTQLGEESVLMESQRRCFWNPSTRQMQEQMSPIMKQYKMEQRRKQVRQQYSKRVKERIYTDPERLQAYRERERRRYHQRKKLIADLPEETQRLRREAWRAAASRYRARKVSGVPQTDPTQPCTLPLNMETPVGTGGCVMGGPQGGSWSTTCGAHLQDSGTYCS